MGYWLVSYAKEMASRNGLVSFVRMVSSRSVRSPSIYPAYHGRNANRQCLAGAFHRKLSTTAPSHLFESPLTSFRGIRKPSTIANVPRSPLSQPFARSMFIQVEETPNPSSLKFCPQVQLLPEGRTHSFPTRQSSICSPLARAIYEVDGVDGVFFSSEHIVVNKVIENCENNYPRAEWFWNLFH